MPEIGMSLSHGEKVLTDDGRERYCPFSANTKRRCGLWCPLLVLNVASAPFTLSLHCGGTLLVYEIVGPIP